MTVVVVVLVEELMLEGVEVEVEEGVEVIVDEEEGEVCSRRVTRVVVGDNASIDHPCKSTCVLVRWTGVPPPPPAEEAVSPAEEESEEENVAEVEEEESRESVGNNPSLSGVKLNTCIVVGDLYTVLSRIVSLGIPPHPPPLTLKHQSSESSSIPSRKIASSNVLLSQTPLVPKFVMALKISQIPTPTKVASALKTMRVGSIESNWVSVTPLESVASRKE